MNPLNVMENTMPSMQQRHSMVGGQSDIFSCIYQQETHIVIWQRSLSTSLSQSAETILYTKPSLEISMVLSPRDAFETLQKALGPSQESEVLSRDIAQLVDMFCSLFEQKRAVIRLSALDRTMCPRFHVDWVPCRLITTYQGVATEWLPHNVADRSKLGTGNMGKPDELSGLFDSSSDIQQLNCGDIALLKGEIWENNMGAGLIHRSPQLSGGNRRLLLTIDFIND
ncbi:MAG: DUF1826 domain-containing protein [Porticoccaceae bacterium]